MTAVTSRASVVIGDLDRQILHCLVIDGRAPYARIAEVLGVSEQTVARRFGRLVEAGVAHVVVARNSVAAGGGSDWFVRLRCRPDGLEAVSAALARRDDAAWVAITSGGSEVVCSIRPPLRGDAATADGGAVLLDRLPRSSAVLAMQAVMLVRKFDSDDAEWTAFSPGLPDGAEQVLLAGRAHARTTPVPPDDQLLRDDDAPLLARLAEDGRATHRALAAATGWSESRVARRVAELFGSGVVDVDLDVSVDALGFRTFAYLWITTPPGRVESLGWELAALPQVAFVAAVTGSAPLIAIVLCRTPEELYGVVTGAIGSLEGVTAVDVAPISRRVKQGGTVVERGRLVIAGGR